MLTKKKKRKKVSVVWYRPQVRQVKTTFETDDCKIIRDEPKWETDEVYRDRRVKRIVRKLHCSRKRAEELLDRGEYDKLFYYDNFPYSAGHIVWGYPNPRDW